MGRTLKVKFLMKRNEFSYTRMTFGQYKGRFLREVPAPYLEWAADHVSDQGLALMFRAELANRRTNWQQLQAQLKHKHRHYQQ